MNRVIRYFPESDLRSGHDGLSKKAKENGFDTRSLKSGEFIFFANKALNKLKIYCAGNVICYLKSPDNKKLELRTIQHLPNFFNGKAFDYAGALRRTISEAGFKQTA